MSPTDQTGQQNQMKNSKKSAAKKTAVKPAAKKPAAKKATTKKSSAVKRSLFECPISHVVHALGALKAWKPSMAIKAIQATKGNANCSAAAIRSAFYNGRNKVENKTRAALSKAQIAMLTKLAA
jgi:hypothetical protein